MILKLWSRGFRNLDEHALTFPTSGHVFIYGKNNQGKSNFLESIYTLIHGRSPLVSDLQHVLNFDHAEALLGADLAGVGDKQRLYLKIGSEGQKTLQVNEALVKSHRQVSRDTPLDYVSAEVIRVLRESPDFRRQDLDQFCKLFSPDYAHQLKQYQRAVKQKNRLLKDGAAASLIAHWQDPILKGAALIVSARLEALDAISALLSDMGPQLGIRYSNIVIDYYFGGKTCLGPSVEAYLSQLREKLQLGLEKERRAGYCLYGPHRDDYRVMIGERDLLTYFSRGISRIFSILLKVAQLRLLEQKGGRFPVLLLDDTFAELDVDMKLVLMAIIKSRTQVVYTSVLRSDMALIEEADCYQMKAGQLQDETS